MVIIALLQLWYGLVGFDDKKMTLKREREKLYNRTVMIEYCIIIAVGWIFFFFFWLHISHLYVVTLKSTVIDDDGLAFYAQVVATLFARQIALR